MSGCMPEDKPLISIVMAVYHPRMDWLAEQLDSLNAQTYPNLELIVCDDGPDQPVEERIFTEHITAFPWELVRNEENLGSNKTFERLTRKARGEYIAYCDQDDIWETEKLARLAAMLEKPDVAMAYCDMSVIDGEGGLTAPSLMAVRPRLRYVHGSELSETYFFRNCTAGCSMLIQKASAKRAIPFPKETVCDQWLAVVAALDGSVAFANMPLVLYRFHGGNQTGILQGVNSKADYQQKRLEPLRERLEFYSRYTVPSSALRGFVEARLENHSGAIWRWRAFCPREAAFEIAMKFLPDVAVRYLLRKMR